MQSHRLLNTFHREEFSVASEQLECLYAEIYRDEFFHKRINHLISRQTEIMKPFKLCWNPFKRIFNIYYVIGAIHSIIFR